MGEGENTMIELLARLFIRGRDALAPSALRRAYGQLCGAVGIGLNLLLFAVKFFAGSVSGSIAITADAFNNLSDAGSFCLDSVWQVRSRIRSIPSATGAWSTYPAWWCQG